MKINMGRETILFYLQNNGLSNAVRQCLFLKQMVLGKESTKIWFAENKDKAHRKNVHPTTGFFGKTDSGNVRMALS